MSSWTYITGTVTTHPLGKGQHAKTFVLNEVLDHLPLVPGSEGPMTWQVLQQDGYSSSCNCDEFGIRTNLRRYELFSHSWQEQDYYTVVLDGKLRDTYYEDTLKAFVKWLNRLSKRVEVSDMLVRVSGHKRYYGWGERIFSGKGCWGDNHLSELAKSRTESVRTRRSTNWRYELMPESTYWPDILVNLLAGGYKLAHDYDLILGNCEIEEYLQYDYKTDTYGDLQDDIFDLLETSHYAIKDRNKMFIDYAKGLSHDR